MRRSFYHLTRQDRDTILEGIVNGESLKNIASTLGKNPTSISREVRKYRSFEGKRTFNRPKICAHFWECEFRQLCGDWCQRAYCKNCSKENCTKFCLVFEREVCRRIARWPYVCNGCPAHKSRRCGLERYKYHPSLAQVKAEKEKSTSRQGLSLSESEMGELDTLITPLVRDNKMSPEAIVAVFKNRISVSASTLRRYIDRGGVGAIRLDLLKAPKRKVRKKRKVHSGHHTDDGRSYSDFEALSTRDKSLAWELDTVCGSKKDRCRFLTLCQRETNFLFIFKIFRNDQESVIGILDYLEALCEDSGYTFSSIFGVLLTDNGSEFGDAKGIETSSLSSAKRCDLYYCDPYSSWQKPHVELAHTLIRRVLPKGTSFESISHRQVSTLCSHINSYPRASLGTSSIEKMGDRLPESLLWEIGVSVIPVKEVYLRPGLLGQTL